MLLDNNVKIKIVEKGDVFAITLPINLVHELNLHAGQKMAIYTKHDTPNAKIYAVPIMENLPDLTYEYSARKITAVGKYSHSMSIPQKLRRNLGLIRRDYIFIQIGIENGVKCLVLTPDKLDREVMVCHNDDKTTTVNKINLKPRNSVDVDEPVVKETVSAEIVYQIIDVTKVNIMKNTQICEIIVPEKIVHELNLHHGQRMAMYWWHSQSNAQKLHVVPLEKNESDPILACNIRIVTAADKYNTTMTIPTKIMKGLNLKSGDYMLIGIENTGVSLYVMLQPDKPIADITRVNDDGTTTVTQYSMKPDGSRDMNISVENETIPTKTAEKVVKMHETDPKHGYYNDECECEPNNNETCSDGMDHDRDGDAHDLFDKSDDGLWKRKTMSNNTQSDKLPEHVQANYDRSDDLCGTHNQKTESVQNKKCDTFNITVTVPKNYSVNITLTSDGLDNISTGTKKQD